MSVGRERPTARAFIRLELSAVCELMDHGVVRGLGTCILVCFCVVVTSETELAELLVGLQRRVL